MSRLLNGFIGSVALLALAAPLSAEDFDLDALIEAARGEEAITAYASTGKIKTSAAAFTEKYGIEVIGSKVPSSAQIEMVIREAQSGECRGRRNRVRGRGGNAG